MPEQKSDRLIRRTFLVRPDQDRALAISLALGNNPHGKDKSAVIRALLDAHGYRKGGEREKTPED